MSLMAYFQQPERPVTAGPTATATANAATASVAITAPTSVAPVLTETNENNNNNFAGTGLAPKRQRRPSVRLGEIGNAPAIHTPSYDSHARRPKAWRFHKDPSLATKTSKTRPLTNLVNGRTDSHETPDANEYVINNNINNSNLEFGVRKPKSKKPGKRIRTNWVGVEGANREENEELRDFEQEEGSESPLKEQSPVHSFDNVGLDSWPQRRRRPVRAWGSESRERDHDNGIPESNSQERNFSGFGEREVNGLLDEGVREWLIGLGLGRYAPVFEIHEVDEEVLPMLTLEDLKDMGINAVGSRRKMYSAILKLRKGFS